MKDEDEEEEEEQQHRDSAIRNLHERSESAREQRVALYKSDQ